MLYFIDLLQFVPLLIGILLVAVQFFPPEMQRKCLKLTFLHLPYSQKKMVMSMLALWRTCTGDLFCYEFYCDGEFICHNILQVSWCSVFIYLRLHGFFAGFAGYLLVSWIA